MVLLTMTPGIARAVVKAEQLSPDDYASLLRADEPALADPKPGNPISHSQLIGLSKLLKKHLPRPCSDVPEEETTEETTQDAQEPIPSTLASLLTNTTLYAPPPPPKPPKTPEYEALMARLRAEQEALSYERMLHPPPTRETFSQRFPRAPEPFSIGAAQAASEEDDLTYEEVHRQIILIINILISIVCVAVFIWVAARHWTVGLRLGLSMGGALGIAVAEVAVYSGYVRKVKEAKRLEKKKPETKEIVKTWVLGEPGQGAEATGWKEKNSDGVRSRKGKHR